MRIGALASKAGVNIQTLRFYEREGLLRAPLRTQSGYRTYEEQDLERVRFIRTCQGLGFTLREIHQLLELHRCLANVNGGSASRPSALRGIVDMGTERLLLIDEKITLLNNMRTELSAMLSGLTVQTPPKCPAAR